MTAHASQTVQAMLARNLVYNCPGSPSNFSIFNFYEKLKDGSENANTLLLHIMSKDGKSRSKEEIKQSLKQVVVAPANYNEMREQTAIFICVTNIFMGKSSLLSLALKDFYGHLIRYSSELKYRIKSDDLLPAKILFAVEEEI